MPFLFVLKWSAFNKWDVLTNILVSLQQSRLGVGESTMLQTASCRNMPTPINQEEILWISHPTDRGPSTTSLKKVTKQRTDLTSLSCILPARQENQSWAVFWPSILFFLTSNKCGLVLVPSLMLLKPPLLLALASSLPPLTMLELSRN